MRIGVSDDFLDSQQTLWDAIDNGFATNSAKIDWLDNERISLTFD
jgi:hypothetical protein